MSTMSDHARLLSLAIAISRLWFLLFLVLMYVLAFINRTNVDYAWTSLQVDTGLGDAAFAFGVSIFFIGYACFEIPSNLTPHRPGIRVWLCRITVTWGLVPTVVMFVDGAMTLYVLRFLLGVAEASFLFSIILYPTYWFPQCSRAQALGLFHFGLLLALVLDGPLPGWLLEFHGIFGLANWQWLSVTEGLLALLIGIVAYSYLVDRPRDAGWLSDEQERVLEGELTEEDTRKQAYGPHGFLSTLYSGQTLKFCLVYLTIQMSVYGVVFYLLTRIAGFFDSQVGLSIGPITAIPWACVLVVTYLAIRQANHIGQRRQFVVVMPDMATAGTAALALAGNLGLAVTVPRLTVSDPALMQPLFQTLPTGYLSGMAATNGIALINSLDNLSDLAAPNLKILMESRFADPCTGMLVLAAVGLLGVCLPARLKISGSPSIPLRARQAG